jgi:EpsI family protein
MKASSFTACAAGLLLTIALVTGISLRPEPKVVSSNIERLPRELGGYQGSDDRFPEAVNRELNADATLYRHYRAADGSRIDLYIGYYGTAKGGRTGHNPYACLPGAGWAIVDTGTVPARSAGAPEDLNYVRARRDGVNTVMLHWYQTAGGTVMSSGIHQNLVRFRSRLLFNRNDGAFVQVTSQASDDQVPQAREKLREFAGIVLEQLPGYWPVEN